MERLRQPIHAISRRDLGQVLCRRSGPVLCLILALTVCSDPADPEVVIEPVDVSGAVQKGPFILGAQVQLNVLDSVGNPTGTVFNTTTTSDKGEFSVGVAPGSCAISSLVG